jgi:hypothetical protein
MQIRTQEPESTTTLVVPEEAILGLGIWADRNHLDFRRQGLFWSRGETYICIESKKTAARMLATWLDGWGNAREQSP